MKKIIIYTIILFSLLGCAVSPKIPNFPDVPEDLTIQCSDLMTVPEGETRLSETLKVVVTNYGLYHECSAKTQTWIEWYNAQKKIYSEIK